MKNRLVRSHFLVSAGFGACPAEWKFARGAAKFAFGAAHILVTPHTDCTGAMKGRTLGQGGALKNLCALLDGRTGGQVPAIGIQQCLNFLQKKGE